MNTYTADKGCKSSGSSELQLSYITCTIISGFSSFLKSVLGTTLPVLATFACGCTEETQIIPEGEQRDIRIHLTGGKSCDEGEFGRLDIFSFNTDSLGRLDAYQHLEDIVQREISVSSTGGRKRIVIGCNLDMSEEDMMKIGTVRDLEEHTCMLENVRRKAPPMLGLTVIEAGIKSHACLPLEPMTSAIVLRSISSCFTGTPYEGVHITEAKVYLINVNAQCCLTESPQTERRFVNMGMLNHEDVAGFAEPDLIVQDIPEDIGKERLLTDISLVCFQNLCENESPGSPFTRLVVEGKIQGETYYWPLTINRTEGGRGIGSNTRHVFDLTIRRKGCLDPDEELVIEDSETMMEVVEWEEKEEYSVIF